MDSQSPQTELAACPTPFCAVPEVYIRRLGGTCRVECKYCGVRTEVFGNEATVIEQWNTRPSPLVDTAEALREALDIVKAAIERLEQATSLLDDTFFYTEGYHKSIVELTDRFAALAARPKPEEG